MSVEVETVEAEVQVEARKPEPVARPLKSREDIENELAEALSKRAQDRARIRDLSEEAKQASALRDEVTKLQGQHRTELAMAKLEAMAIKEGVVDTDALRLIDGMAIKFGDDGKPSNLPEVLADFKAAKPHFFEERTTNTSTSSTAQPPAPRKGAATDAREMSSKEFDAYWASLKG